MSYILLVEQAEPATPSTNSVLLYPKTDGRMYSKDDAGTERAVSASASATTDNAVARYDGTAGALQNSGILISDVNALTMTGALTQGTNSSGNTATILDSAATRLVHKLSGDTASQFFVHEWENNSNVEVANDWMTGDVNGTWRRQIAGTGVHDFITNTVSIANNTPQFRVKHTAGTIVNFLSATGAATGADAALTAEGTDTNRSINLVTAGTGTVKINGATISSPATATQAEQEAASSTTVYTSPGRQHFHPGMPKFWLVWNTSGTTISASYNVTSVTNLGTGNEVITIATDFSSADWAPFLMVQNTTDNTARMATIGLDDKAAGTIEFFVFRAGTEFDTLSDAIVSAMGLGDHA